MRPLIFLLVSACIAAPIHAQTYLGHGTVVGERQLSESESQEFGFGQAVVRYGDQLIVGATAEELGGHGTVIAYRRDAGAWVEFQRFSVGDAATIDWFGYALVMAGDTLAVGAPATGEVHLFGFDATRDAWVPVQTLTEPQPGDAAYFGHALAYADGTLFVAAPYAPPDRLYSPPTGAEGTLGGRVYAFRVNAETWTLVQTLAGVEDVPLARFGAALATDGGRLVIGATGEGDGAVYGYTLADGTATLVDRYENVEADGMIHGFGRSLSLRGDTLLVGSTTSLVVSVTVSDGPPGRAYVLEFTDDGLTPSAALEGIGSRFGWEVLLLDDRQALVAAPHNGGTILHYIDGPDGWQAAQRIVEPVQSTFRAGDFGDVMALEAGALYVGMPRALHDWGSLPAIYKSGNLYEIPLLSPPLAEFSLAVAGPESVADGETVDLEFVVAAADGAEAVATYLDVRTNMRVVTTPAGCFELRATITRCELGAIAVGSSRTVPFAIQVPTAVEMIHASLRAYVGSERAEAVTADNALYHQFDRQPPGNIETPSGGGGSLGWLWALFLLGMLEFRFGPRRSSRCSAPISASPVSTPNSPRR